MKFVTYLNYGCVDICRNMLESAKNVGINLDDFYVACLDDESFNEFKDIKNSFLFENVNVKEYQNWTFDADSGYRYVNNFKWKVINHVYKAHKNLCYVDSDIVFIKNPIDLLKDNKLLQFQSDSYPEGSVICAGFMVLNPSLECEYIVEQCCNVADDDQLFLNKLILTKYKHCSKILDEDLFPNGNVYYKQGRKDKAYIVHNNWMIGIDTKIQKFKEEGLWFI